MLLLYYLPHLYSVKDRELEDKMYISKIIDKELKSKYNSEDLLLNNPKNLDNNDLGAYHYLFEKKLLTIYQNYLNEYKEIMNTNFDDKRNITYLDCINNIKKLDDSSKKILERFNINHSILNDSILEEGRKFSLIYQNYEYNKIQICVDNPYYNQKLFHEIGHLLHQENMYIKLNYINRYFHN